MYVITRHILLRTIYIIISVHAQSIRSTCVEKFLNVVPLTCTRTSHARSVTMNFIVRYFRYTALSDARCSLMCRCARLYYCVPWFQLVCAYAYDASWRSNAHTVTANWRRYITINNSGTTATYKQTKKKQNKTKRSSRDIFYNL